MIGVASLGDALGNQAEQHLGLAHAHVVTQEGAAPALDSVVRSHVGRTLVGEVGASHAWHEDRCGRGQGLAGSQDVVVAQARRRGRGRCDRHRSRRLADRL